MRAMRLFKRGPTWYVEFGRGKKKSLKTGNEAEAKALFKELEREWHKGRLHLLEAESNVSLGDFKIAYLKSRETLSQKTQKQDALALALLCDAVKASTPLKLINPKRVQDFIDVCVAKGNRPASINSYLRHIKSALSTAEEWELIPKRPKIKMLKLGQHLPRYLRKEEIEAIMSKAQETRPDFYPLLQFYLWTGARRNEALSLEWRDVSLGEAQVILTGKGDKQRVVPLLPNLIEVLEEIRKDVGKVFVQINESTATHWFKEIARACGVEARLHDMRHTAATYMLACGIPLTMVQEIMGHADLSTTSVYAHVVKEHLHREMSKLKFD